MKPTVSVITSSIGRPELRQCVDSVAAQTYPCRHYVFVNGPKYHDGAVQTLKSASAHAVFLPEETGDWGHGFTCNGVFAAGPHLTQSDWIFYLNDDDFFDPNHVESIMALVQKHDLKWAYSLRKFVSASGEFIAEDNWNSLGHWPPLDPDGGPRLVDNSCLAIERRLACKIAMAWHALPVISDRCVVRALMDTGERYGSTGLYTTNYRIGTGTAEADPAPYLASDRIVRQAFPQGFPWTGEHVFG